MTYNRGNVSAQVNANRNRDEQARRRSAEESARKAAEEAARKAEEERKRREAEAKAKAEAEAAQRAAEEAAAQNHPEAAEGTSVMNFKPTAAQRHDIQANAAWNRAEKKLVEAAPLDLLPPEMEEQRDELEAKNQAGQLGSARLKKYSSTDNQYSVDATQFGNVKELAYFCSNLFSDADRVKLYKRYAEKKGLDIQDLYYQAETMLGGRAFDYPQSARGQMEYIGVYDAAGNKLDLSYATQAQVKQAIRMTPPGDDHDALLKAYRTMFGDWKTDDSDFAFMDSADLTESDYEKAVKEFKGAFTFSDGHTPENQAAYLDALDNIYRDYENPRVQQQMIRQLNLAYADRTGMQAMSEDELLALAKENGYIGTDDVDENGERKGFFKGLWDAAQDAVSKAFGEKPEAKRHIPDVEEVTSSAAAAQGGSGAPGGGYYTVESASGYAAMGQAPALDTAEEAAAETAAIAIAENNPEVQGPVYRPQDSATDESNAADSNARYISSVPYNADMTDDEALALWRKGEKLDERNMAQISWLTDNANVMGLVGNMGMYANMGQMASGGRNVVAKAVKYGNRLGTAAMVIGNGGLPEDIENETILTLGNVVDQIDRLVADPSSGIAIPSGMNQYDYVLSLPQYAHLAEQVDAATGIQADVNAAFAQQAQLEKEAHDKHIESIKAKMLRGEGTPEMAQELAQAYGTEYVDLWDDELYAVYKTLMGERQRFFSDNGTFWQGNSAAAQEGNRLRSAGRGYGEFKSSLKYETESLLGDFTTAAKQMGMTLEEYFNAAGIDSLDQVVNIAYNDMISRGNAYSKDEEAQAAAQMFVESDLGAWDAVSMGAQHGVESYASDFMQTAYMAIDAADYSTAVIDLQNEYTSKYGVDMAAAMYRADLLAYIDSGAMSEESAADLLDHMKRARSIFDVAYELDPGFLEGLARNGYEKMQKDVEGLEAAAAGLSSDLRAVFNMVSGGAYSLTGMAAATVFGGMTGSAAAGSALAWGGTEWSSAYDANRAKGMSPGMAGFAALGNAGVAAAVNMGGTGTDMDIWWKGSALPEFTKAMKGRNAVTMLKDMAALTGKYAVKRGAEEAGEEVSETLFGTAFDLTDNAMLAIDSGKPVTPSALLRSIGDAVRETDFDALGKELLTSAGMGFTMGGIFSLGGSAKTMLAAKKGINMRSRYSSIDLAAQMAEGNVSFTEENIGKVYAAVQKDLLDARFRKYIDSNHSAALEQRATVAAAMMGSAEQTRTTAVENAQKAQEYEAKAEAAREASKTASGRWWELRDRLAGGDLSVEVEMESARMQWQKAETTLQENENAAGKAMEKAQEAMTAWLRECRAQAGQIKSWMLQEQADQIAQMRMSAAEELARRYEEIEAREPVDGPRREQTESAVFGPDVYGRTEADMEAEEDIPSVDTMTDEEIDAEYSALASQIGEAEKHIADVTAQNAELGLDGETVQAMVDQELTPLSQRRDRLITRETNRFNDLFDRIQQAIEMDNDEAADQLQIEYDSVMARLEGMGVNTEALVMAQYGVTPESVAEGEATTQAEAENAEQERLTESLSRRMEHTAMEIERIQPARKYFMDTPLYVNASQKAEILSSEGLKSLSNVNRKYNMKLTDKEAAGAMPLDGHVLSDIAAESAGVVDESANPVEEMLRIMQTGKKLAEDQKTEKNEARELSKKKKAADKRRRESVGKLTGAESKPEQQVNQIDALDTGADAARVDSAAPTTPAQNQQTLNNKEKKLESNALRAVETLADSIGVGFRIKSDARFQSADARVGSGVAGYYKNGQRNAIVRSKQAGKLEVSGHEIGHAVQEQLGIHSTQTMIDSWKKNFQNTGVYKPNQYDHEAFAEFFWRYLTGRDAAIAYADEASVDAFEYAMRKNRKLLKAMQKAQTQVSAYYNSSDTGAKIQANIAQMSEADKKNKSPFVKRAVAAIADDTAVIEDFQNVIRKRIGEGHLPYDLNLRDTIRYNRRASARAAQCISEAMVDNDGNVIGESLADVFSEIKGKDYDLYMQWWLARHSIDRDRRKGKKDQVFAESDISTADRTKFIAETEFAHPEFSRTNERFQKWRRLFLDTYLVNNGLMGDPARATALLDMLEQIYPYYAPTKRTNKGGIATSVSRGVKGQKTYAMREATGSTETIIDPFESFVSMVNSVVSLTAENENRKKFAELYDTFSGAAPGDPGAGMGMFANEITQDMQKNVVDTEKMRKRIEQILDDIDTDPDVVTEISDIIGDQQVQYRGKGRVDMNSVIRVRGEDGKDRYFEIYNPQLFELLATVSGQAGNRGVSFWEIVGKYTRTMSMLTTGSNPVFGITNAMRDFQNSVNYGSWATSYIDGAVKWLATLGDVITNSDVSKEYDALGGGGWSQYDTRTKKGSERTRSEVFKGYNRKNIGQIGKTAGRVLWRVATMEDLNGWIEKTSRLAEYKYGKHDLSTAEGRIEAFLAAQDVTTDFARRGGHPIAREFKNLIPFFNASTQGVYRNARQFTAQESDRAKIRLAKQITNTALASLLANALLLEFLDDDEKEEFTYLSQDLTTKHMFLPNPDPDFWGDAMLIRIPLDQNPISYAINAAVSNMVWKGETSDDFLVSMAALSDVIMENLNPVSSTILDPVLAVQSNKNWYGSKIVPTYLESYDALNQYTEETPTAFVKMAEALAMTGKKVSPMMIQYMAEQYTGYVGQTLIPALSSEKNDNGFIAGAFAALAATARKRVTSDPLKSNDVISMVYDSFNEMNAVSKAGKSKRDFEIDYLKPSLNDRDKRRAIDEAYDLTHSGGELYEAKKELGTLDDEIDEINARDDLTDRQKYLLISEIRKEKIEIALDVQETMNDYDVRYRYDGILPRMLAKMLLNQ